MGDQAETGVLRMIVSVLGLDLMIYIYIYIVWSPGRCGSALFYSFFRRIRKSKA